NKNCPSIRLPNGWVRLRSNNRIARFSCNQHYELIAYGCPKITPRPPLKSKKFNDGRVLDLSCDLGYYLKANISTTAIDSNELNAMSSFPFQNLRLYCVGKTWIMDDPRTDISSFVVGRVPISGLPSCDIYQAPVSTSMNCSFEDSLCGWFQDQDDEFDWSRNQHTTPSHLDGTELLWVLPVLESSYPRTPGEIARLYSPVYTHLEGTSDACFEFYYHMYGKAIGGLRVYVLEKSKALRDLVPKWEVTGDQGDVWIKAQVEINGESGDQLQPFQLIFEGILGHGHQGDIAIDDLALTLGQNCTNYNSSMALSPDLVVDIENEIKTANDTSTEGPNAEGASSSFTPQTVSNTSELNSTPIIPIKKSKNSTSVQALINQVKDHIKTKLIPSLVKKISSSNSSLSDTTSIRPIISLTTPMSIGKPNGSSLPFDWDKTLKDKLDKNIQKAKSQNVPLLVELHNSTAKTPTGNGSGSSPTEDHLLNSTATLKSSLSGTSSSQQPRKPFKLFASSFAMSVLTLLVLLVIIISTLYIAYVYRPTQLNRSNLDQFVASFVRRCKGLSRTPDSNEEADELLMMGNNVSGDAALESNSTGYPPNSDHAYDNAHLSEGVVYLHSANEKY
ncbi:MAM domain-containing glycosylphosphatidylinositol anchor protein 2, partial [Tyrophagus putrescentiae]